MDCIDLDERVCIYCGIQKPLEAFPLVAKGSSKRRTGCKACQSIKAKRYREVFRERTGMSLSSEYLSRYPEKRSAYNRASGLKKKFGISTAEYDNLLSDQGGVCAVCGNPETVLLYGKPKALAVDHCHTTGKVRGLLCSHCNMALGLLNDDPVVIGSLQEYVLKYKESPKKECEVVKV